MRKGVTALSGMVLVVYWFSTCCGEPLSGGALNKVVAGVSDGSFFPENCFCGGDWITLPHIGMY